MELKTKVNAEDGKQELFISRTFDISLALLFKAYTDPAIVAQWMGTKVVKLENRTHGSYQFETSDPNGNIVFRANGIIHQFIPEQKITRTFEMENSPFGIQLEFLEFEALTADTSKLTIQSIYRTTALRDQMLQLPFKKGLNLAHQRLEDLLKNKKDQNV
ncbi:MAG: SRPBCC domain-containing protein [Pedobacter sp.]|nr:SRPBCC domain-containing protein [Pedobacter sp.]MDQ8052299.1 SRPBCC domain-containing protein [Pedobacter sp.]